MRWFRSILKCYKLLFGITVIALMMACRSQSLPTLLIFTWSDFLKPELIRQFEEKFHCRVIVDLYDSNESMYAKLKLSGAGYDIIFPSNYYVEILQNQGMIQPIDPSKVENIKNLDPVYFKMTNPLPGIPFMVSFSGIAYRTDRIASIDPSWGVFGRKDLKGRMTMLNDYREALGAALKYLGYSVNTKNPQEVERAGDQLIAWKPNLAKFESEQYKNGISSAEFLLVQAYSIDIIQVIEEDNNIEFVYPKEGAIMSIDYIAIPTGARNPDLAQAFINFMLDKEVAAKNMTYTNSLIPVLNAYPLLDPIKKEDSLLFPPKEALQKMELIEDLHDATQLYYKTWDRVKAS